MPTEARSYQSTHYSSFHYKKGDLQNILNVHGTIGLIFTNKSINSKNSAIENDNEEMVIHRVTMNGRTHDFEHSTPRLPLKIENEIEFWTDKNVDFVFFDTIQLNSLLSQLPSSASIITFAGASIDYGLYRQNRKRESFPTLNAQIKQGPGATNTEAGVAIGVPCPIMWGRDFLGSYISSLIQFQGPQLNPTVTKLIDELEKTTNPTVPVHQMVKKLKKLMS